MTAAVPSLWVAEVDLLGAGPASPEGICRGPLPADAGTRLLVRAGRTIVGLTTVRSTDVDDIRAAVVRRPGAPVDSVAPPATEPVTVVVCTRDRPELFAGCLKALQQQRYGRYEVVVVDNAPSSDATLECFERIVGDDPRFRYVCEPVTGLSRARNRGMAEARTRIVAFTDDDTLVDSWWLVGIAEGFSRAPLVGCVTGLVPGAELDHPAQQYFERRFSWSARLQGEVYRMSDERDPSTLYPYSAGLFGTGANFAVDRRLLLDLGGFDEALGAGSPAGGGEELDAFVRVLRAGRPLVYEPSAIVWHVHRADRRDARRQLFFYGAGLTAFLAKHLLDADTARDVLVRLAPGVRRMWQLWRAAARRGGAPTALVLIEAAGMALGPLAYVRGRRRAHRRRRT